MSQLKEAAQVYCAKAATLLGAFEPFQQAIKLLRNEEKLVNPLLMRNIYNRFGDEVRRLQISSIVLLKTILADYTGENWLDILSFDKSFPMDSKPQRIFDFAPDENEKHIAFCLQESVDQILSLLNINRTDSGHYIASVCTYDSSGTKFLFDQDQRIYDAVDITEAVAIREGLFSSKLSDFKDLVDYQSEQLKDLVAWTLDSLVYRNIEEARTAYESAKATVIQLREDLRTRPYLDIAINPIKRTITRADYGEVDVSGDLVFRLVRELWNAGPKGISEQFLLEDLYNGDTEKTNALNQIKSRLNKDLKKIGVAISKGWILLSIA